jgi:hypothetical protein
MSPSPQRATFIVPEMPVSTTSAPKPTRDATPFVMVPTPLAADELEAHWHSTIDAATD